tara:strand:- start:704 stop:1096 length:393 start_codon:yes stop_codon:yes gene_type:complete
MKIKIPSITDNVSVVESFIDNLKEKTRLSDNVYGNILISVTEAVNNAIVHGNKEDKEKKVELFLKQTKKSISFVIKDEGSGFDESKIPDPTSPKNLDNIKGRGVFLIKNLADNVKFRKKGSEVELVFNLY